MSRPFSLFFIVFLKFFWQYADAHGSGANVPLRAISRSGISFPIRPPPHIIMVYRSDTKNTGMLCTPVFLIIYEWELLAHTLKPLQIKDFWNNICTHFFEFVKFSIGQAI